MATAQYLARDPFKIVQPAQVTQAAQQEAPGFNLPSAPAPSASAGWEDFLGSGTQAGQKIPGQSQFFQPGPAGSGFNGDYQGYFNYLFPGDTLTGEQLKSRAGDLQIAGLTPKTSASGNTAWLTTPQGNEYDVIRDYGGANQKQWLQSGGPGMQSAYSSQFSDPLTAQYEQMLQQQTGLYQQQQAQMQAEAARQEQTRAATAAAIQRLTDYMNQRVAKLQGPAYTDSEANILKTRATDPIEQDRTAALQRALENVGSRGFDPTSGIAQQLLGDVNRGYDQQRAGAQNDLAYQQIQEQRSREQEAQQLLQYLAQAPEAAARGDVNFLQFLDQAINQPGQNGLATSALLSDLPVQRTQLAAQVAGLGGQPQSSVPNVLALLNSAQANRYQNQNTTADFWRSLGLSF